MRFELTFQNFSVKGKSLEDKIKTIVPVMRGAWAPISFSRNPVSTSWVTVGLEIPIAAHP